MWIDTSYWGVQGWEASGSTSKFAGCFHVGPKYSAPSTIHHIIVANNVANGCMNGGVDAYDNSNTASFDYVAFVGNIVYNAVQGNSSCGSGINMYQPIASDTAVGTHLYIAGNFSYGNIDPPDCSGSGDTDGEGINLDTFDFDQGGGAPYTQQAAVENNIVFNNGGRGIEVENNRAGTEHAQIFIQNNTVYGDMTDMNQTYCQGNGEILVTAADNITVADNIAQTARAVGCQSDPVFALSVANSGGTTVSSTNVFAGENGNNIFVYNSSLSSYSGGGSPQTSPALNSPPVPGAPNCSGMANAPDCMRSVVADFAPKGSGTGDGYQVPSATSNSDPLFPQWLCNANLPNGLVTMGCNEVSGLTGGFINQ
jgi:hypothetical protein